MFLAEGLPGSLFLEGTFSGQSSFPTFPGPNICTAEAETTLCAQISVSKLLVFSAGADQNHPLYLGHLRSGGSQWHQNCIQAALRAADEPSHGLLTASLCAFVQSIK